MTDNGEVSPRIDYARHVFIARDGTELELRPIPKLILERLYNDKTGRPKPPLVDVTIAGQFARKQANPNDPDYLKACEQWDAERNLRLTRYVLTYGIKTDAPESFAEEYREFFPHANAQELRYLWVAQLLGETNAEDWKVLTEGIISQTAVTESGVAQATEQFPSDSERLAG